MVLDYFDPPIAYNPDAEDLVTGATFQVFAVDDTAYATPLPVTDPASGANIPVLASNNIGVLPAFRVAGNPSQVVLRSGAFTTLLTSRYGIFLEVVPEPEALGETLAAVQQAKLDVEAVRDEIPVVVPQLVTGALEDSETLRTAVEERVDAEVDGREFAEVKLTVDEDVLFSIVDEDDRRSWLEFDSDGAPTEYSSGLIREKIEAPIVAEVSSQIGVEEQESEITGLFFAVVDEDGRRTDLEVGNDGHFTQRVIDYISSRIVIPAPANPTRAILPSNLRLLQGLTYRLNYADIVHALSADYRIRITGPAGSSGNLGTHWQYTPTAPGSWTLTVTVLDRAGAVVTTVGVPVTVYAPVSSTAMRLLSIGDSITRPNLYNSQAAAAVGGSTRGTRTYDNGVTCGEGRGGWSLNGYFTNIGHEQWGDSPFLFPVGVPGEKFWGATEFWRKVCYDDPNGYDYQGFQRIARGWAESGPFLYNAQGYPTSPTEGDVVVDATFPEDQEFRQYVSGSWVLMSPQPTVEFSFSKYMARYAAAFAGGPPTAISLMLSTNDWFSSLQDTAWDTWVSRVNTLIASVRAWSATVPIIVIAAPTGGPDSQWAGQSVNRVDFNARMREVATRQAAVFDTSAMRTNHVHFVSFLGSVAPENMADHVHPANPAGQAQFASWLAGKLAQLINGGT